MSFDVGPSGNRTESKLVLPEPLKPIRRQSRVTDGRVDRLVPKVVLDRPGVLAVVCQLVAAGMPQHVAVNDCLLWANDGHSACIRHMTFGWRTRGDQGPLYGSDRWSHALGKAAWAAFLRLTSYLAVANGRKTTGTLLIDTNKDIRPRATPIKRLSNDMAMSHTPCRLTNTHRRR